jgi:hypothetical protein
MIRTTQRHFDLFIKECQGWVEPLGLTGWELHFLWEKQKDLATISDDHKNKYAIITFTKTWHDGVIKLNQYSIKEAAFHEMMELKLGVLKGKEADVHDIIYTIERLLKWPMKRK